MMVGGNFKRRSRLTSVGNLMSTAISSFAVASVAAELLVDEATASITAYSMIRCCSEARTPEALSVCVSKWTPAGICRIIFCFRISLGFPEVKFYLPLLNFIILRNKNLYVGHLNPFCHGIPPSTPYFLGALVGLEVWILWNAEFSMMSRGFPYRYNVISEGRRGCCC
jgi:hypothetical protein